MKILFGGGGTGGHFYPIIAIVEALNKIIEEEKILEAKIYYVSDSPYDASVLFENGITYREIPTGKIRGYFSILNLIDIVKTGIGVLKAIWELYFIYPDIVFGKGGYASFPVLFAARVLGIPVFIHESDSVPGRTNLWASKFAKRIAISYEEASTYFPKDKTAFTGQPVRREILKPITEGAYEFLKLDPSVPTILVLGGSQGAEIVNEGIQSALPELVKKYQIIHQVGARNLKAAEEVADVILKNNPNKERYLAFPYLNDISMRMSAGISSLVISRAGSAIFEIASWGKASIIIPITESNGNHQLKNAFNYARAGACEVIEENNLKPDVLVSEINKIMDRKDVLLKMESSAKAFYKPDAAKIIAREILNLAILHER